jgi:hypothetical protein
MRRSSLRWTIPLFLGLQVALLWLQGVQIHRQNQVLQGLRDDIQTLADSMSSMDQPSGGYAEEDQFVPSAFQSPQSPAKDEKQMAVLGAQEEQDATAKELQASRESGRKAVAEAREAQSKLSWEENAKKADETRKVQAATQSWQRWSLWALALVAVALGGRAILRRRG